MVSYHNKYSYKFQVWNPMRNPIQHEDIEYAEDMTPNTLLLFIHNNCIRFWLVLIVHFKRMSKSIALVVASWNASWYVLMHFQYTWKSTSKFIIDCPPVLVLQTLLIACLLDVRYKVACYFYKLALWYLKEFKGVNDTNPNDLRILVPDLLRNQLTVVEDIFALWNQVEGNGLLLLAAISVAFSQNLASLSAKAKGSYKNKIK